MKNEVQILNPLTLIETAVKGGAGIEQLEKLMNLQERHQKNIAEKEFHLAMNDFQSKKPKLVKTKDVIFNGSKKYNFLPLADMQALIDPVLSGCGLSYSWEQTGENGKIKITCMVSHIAGHSKKTYLEASADTSGGKNSIQAIGSAVSYLKRYTLENALGLAAADDDGNTAIDLVDSSKFKVGFELAAMFIMKKSRLTESQIINLERIIIEAEELSYAKALSTLKTL